MKLVVGLGNPGSQYEATRHNVGFMVVDRLWRRLAPEAVMRSQFRSGVVEARLDSEKMVLMKPMTYMNLSGPAVGDAVRFFKVDLADLLVIADDAALPVGDIRIRKGGSDGGHNGLADIAEKLATTEYPRLRLGIDPPPRFVARHDWVLSRFTPEHAEVIEPALERAADAVLCWASDGIDAAMNRFNTRRPKPAPDQRGSQPTPSANETEEARLDQDRPES